MKSVGAVNLKNLKIDLPKTWREVSRMGGENQIYIKICHKSPLSKLDPKTLQDQILPSSSPNVTITKMGIPAPAHNFEGGGDFSTDITIARYQTEEIARQSFKNMALMPTQGFNVPVPGGVKMPGLPENVTSTELLESDAYGKFASQYMSKEQLEKVRSEIKKVQKQIQEEVKPSLSKSGVKYKETKYLGYEVICAEGKNPTPPPKPKSSFRKDPEGGGGFDDRLDPLPKITQPYAEKTAIYQAVLVKDFVITGSLLWAAAALPSGNTPCYSLTQSKKKTTTTREGGKVFTDIAIVPVVSNYAKEGYLHKEEVEEIFRTIFLALKNYS